MKLVKLFAFVAFTLLMGFVFANCSGGKSGGDFEREYVCSNMIFNFSYSGSLYELVDLDFEIYVNDIKAKNIRENKSEGNVSLEVGGLPSLARVNVYLTKTRNSTLVDSSKKYSNTTQPSFSVTRCFSDGSIERGGTVTVSGESFSNYDSNQIEEYISNYNVSSFSIDLDHNGAIM